MTNMNVTRLAPLAAALLLAAGCGGSSAPAPGFAVKGTVSGLAGSNLVLHLGPASPGQDLAVPPGATSFAFPGGLPDGSAYAVTVKTQPASPTQACVVGGGSGTIAGADASVTVTCTTVTFPVGGSVSGLAGGTLVLRNNGEDDLAVVADGPFTFAAPVASGASFAVTVAQQPATPSQTCAVAGGTGTVVAGPVTSVAVTCEPNDKPVAGTVSGLAGATGVVLTVNGAYDTTLTSNGAFEVLTNLRGGAPWTLAVKTQPTSPWQTCTVTPGTGTGTMGATGAGGAVVTCATDAFAVGGTVSGLLQAGLSVSLTVGGVTGPPLDVAADGSFAFPAAVPSGQAYLVDVVTSPLTQACTVAQEGGVVAGAPVADVTVTCGCAPGLASCTQLTQDGCEVDTRSDATHCGGCGRACAFPNGVATCAAGACQLAGCLAGFDDCNLAPADGCEADLATDPTHCGSCQTACGFANAAALCTDRSCALGACDTGFANCDTLAATGCEIDLRTSAANCGGCGNACSLPNVATPTCAAAQCAVGTCSDGFGNCDGQAVNGCEADLTSDRFNCGTCGRDCSYTNGVGACAAGQCALTACTTGFGNCDGDATNGCETSTSTSGTNCGTCGHVCSLPNAAPSCSGGLCNTAQCLAGFGDCNGVVADGCERPTTDDPLNCGGCGSVCVSDRVCSAGTCQLAQSCRELLLQRPGSASGTYTIDPDGAGTGGPVQVFCDMTTDGGGWTFFAHVNGDYQAGRLFEVDLGTYDPARGDGNLSYGRGGSVYQHLGATEIMVTVDVVDTLAARNSDRFVVYQFAVGAPAFDTGPVPSLAPGALFKYRTHFDPFADGIIEPNFFEDVWAPYTAEPDFIQGGWLPVAPLTILYGTTGLGTYWGSGMAPPGTPGVDTTGHDSWWYAR